MLVSYPKHQSPREEEAKVVPLEFRRRPRYFKMNLIETIASLFSPKRKRQEPLAMNMTTSIMPTDTVRLKWL